MNFQTTTLAATQPTHRSITIDWSQPFTEDQASEENIEAAVEWLKRYPNTKDIHVIVGKAQQKRFGRRLQSALQSLGCQVTTRQSFVRSA